MEILKVASSLNILNGRNDLMDKLFPSSVIRTQMTTRQVKQKEEFWQPIEDVLHRKKVFGENILTDF